MIVLYFIGILSEITHIFVVIFFTEEKRKKESASEDEGSTPHKRAETVSGDEQNSKDTSRHSSESEDIVTPQSTPEVETMSKSHRKITRRSLREMAPDYVKQAKSAETQAKSSGDVERLVGERRKEDDKDVEKSIEPSKVEKKKEITEGSPVQDKESTEKGDGMTKNSSEVIAEKNQDAAKKEQKLKDAEEKASLERKEKELEEKAKKEQKEKEAEEKARQERQKKDAEEKATKEQKEKDSEEKVRKEQKEKDVQEKARKERKEKEATEKAKKEKELEEKTRKERKEKEAEEKARKERKEREAVEKARKEKEAGEKARKERAEKAAEEKTQKETKDKEAETAKKSKDIGEKTTPKEISSKSVIPILEKMQMEGSTCEKRTDVTPVKSSETKRRRNDTSSSSSASSSSADSSDSNSSSSDSSDEETPSKSKQHRSRRDYEKDKAKRQKTPEKEKTLHAFPGSGKLSPGSTKSKESREEIVAEAADKMDCDGEKPKDSGDGKEPEAMEVDDEPDGEKGDKEDRASMEVSPDDVSNDVVSPASTGQSVIQIQSAPSAQYGDISVDCFLIHVCTKDRCFERLAPVRIYYHFKQTLYLLLPCNLSMQSL